MAAGARSGFESRPSLGQPHREGAPPPLLAVDLDPPTQRPRHPCAQVQPEAHALLGAAARLAVKEGAEGAGARFEEERGRIELEAAEYLARR